MAGQQVYLPMLRTCRGDDSACKRLAAWLAAIAGAVTRTSLPHINIEDYSAYHA